MEESMHITFEKSNPSSSEKVVVDDDANENQQEDSSRDSQKDAHPKNRKDRQKEQTNMDEQECISQILPKEWRYVTFHPKDLILGDPSKGITTRSSFRNTCEHAIYFSNWTEILCGCGKG